MTVFKVGDKVRLAGSEWSGDDGLEQIQTIVHVDDDGVALTDQGVYVWPEGHEDAYGVNDWGAVVVE